MSDCIWNYFAIDLKEKRWYNIVKEKYKRVVIMEVKYSKAALKFLAKSDKATVNRIRIGIKVI